MRSLSNLGLWVPALGACLAVGCSVTPLPFNAETSAGASSTGAKGSSTGARTNAGSSTGAEGSSTGGTSSGASGGSVGSSGGTGAGASSGGSSTGDGGAPDGGVGDGGGDGGVGDGGVDAGPQLTVGGIEFVNVNYPNASDPFLGVNYETNYTINPTAEFVFQVQDPTGKLAVPGTTVTFTTDPANQHGAYLISAGSCTATSQSSGTCVSDAKGQVAIGLHSGTGACSVAVTASVTLTDGTTANSTGTSQVVGTQPNVGKSSFSCATVNLAALTAGNSPCNGTTNSNLQTTCTVKLYDRFNNPIVVSVPVQFYTEAGSWLSAVVNTPAYGATGTATPGAAQNILAATGNLPEDVPPLPVTLGNPQGEPSYDGTCSIVNRTFNPRDGLVTVIAVFSGEEAFLDQLGTGSWVPGDPWVDLPQPYVDYNDNSVWDPDELCVGGAGPGGCAAPNHMWDANSSVWLETRVLFSGDPDQAQTVWEPATFTVSTSNPAQSSILWPDINLNVPADSTPGGTVAYNVAPFGSTCQQAPTVTYPAPQTNAKPGDTLGMTVTPFGLPNTGNPNCVTGYFIAPDGGQQANPYCTPLTAITDFKGGWLGTYKITESSACGNGSETIQASAQSSLDSNVDLVQLLGVAK